MAPSRAAGLQKSDLLDAVANLPLTRDYFTAALTKTDLTPNPERALDRQGGRQNFQVHNSTWQQ